MTDTDRIAALEAQVGKLAATVAELQQQPSKEIDGRAVLSAIRREIRLGGANDLKRDLGIK